MQWSDEAIFVTSVLEESSYHPPTTLSLPFTIDALAESNDLGRELRGDQAEAPGRSVSTEER